MLAANDRGGGQPSSPRAMNLCGQPSHAGSRRCGQQLLLAGSGDAASWGLSWAVVLRPAGASRRQRTRTASDALSGQWARVASKVLGE
ncbi:hypothetical protein Dimus_037141, partial [Dionaea muscipula]